MNTFVAGVRSSVEEKLRNQPLFQFPNIIDPIFRVPDALRRVNPSSYTPRLVAIGPLHRDNPQLKPMEYLKLSFLREFLEEMNDRIDSIITFIMNRIKLIHYFYKETENIPQTNYLCEMMLLDSVFIIQIFLKKSRRDPIFDNYWWFRDLMHDFLLIENQIPLVIPCTIYSYYYCQSGGEHNHGRFTSLAKNFFRDVMIPYTSLPRLAYFLDAQLLTEPSNFTENVTSFFRKPNHLIECLMMAYFPRVTSPPNMPSQQASLQLDSKPRLLPLTQKKSSKKGSWKFGVATASRLLEYGVKFMVSVSTSLVEIEFEPQNGILRIPKIKVNDWTETLFRNLIAFEHCQHLTPRYVTDYIIFMDSLIDTPEGVNILTDKRIIQDDLQDPVKVSELFNNLYKEVITENRHYYFSQISWELNEYRRDWRHRCKATWYNWMVILRHNYFNSPWSIVSSIAAVILLGLTLVQTLCSIYQAKGIKM